MNNFDSTESQNIFSLTNNVPNPAYPNPPGGQTPDLQLAQWPNMSGASFQPMPDPGKPDPMDYALVGDPCMGGVDPSNSTPPAPNLAGADGWPLPSYNPDMYQPDYGMPDGSEPVLKTANLADDGISFEPRAEYEPDPMNPDLTSYNQPYGLTIHNPTVADLYKPDPVTGDLSQPDIPGGIVTLRDPFAPDPLVPDLQNPQLSQDVHMVGRPGEMADDAVTSMKNDPLMQSALAVPYEQSFSDGSGMNTTRRRHLDLMAHGLQDVEK
jgi:hypothetical protein